MRLAFRQTHLYRFVNMVRLKGFEPPTFWFVAKHSIQLSYSRIPQEKYLSLTAYK